MGMFDTVIVRYPLPDSYEATDFQTKCFECELDTYVIEENGELWKRNEPWYAKWPDEELAEKPPERIMFNGVLNFYDYDQRALPPLAAHDESRWHEYEATFHDGVLREIERREPLVAEGET